MKTYGRQEGRPGVGRRDASGRKPWAAPPVAPPPVAPTADEIAGPRPVSARQQAHREGRISSANIIERTVPRRAVPAPQTAPPGYRRTHIRDSDTTVRRVRGESQRAEARRNRRRANWWAASLRVAVAALVVEAVMTLLFSPRLYVTQTTITGNATVPTARLMALLQMKAKQNIVRLPVGRMRNALLGVPEIAQVSIHRYLPGTVQVVVTERQPWASVCVPGSGCWTIDNTFVPFRATADPEPNLPKVRLADAASPDAAHPDVATPPLSVTLGKPLVLPGLSVVGQCLAWAAGERFPVASVEIAADGKLCLNKVGGAQIQLGSSMDLDAKLKSLSLLLARHPELRDDPDLAYVNLFDKDGPAVMTKTALAVVTKNAALAKANAGGAGTDAGDNAATAGAVGTVGRGDTGSTGGTVNTVNHAGGAETETIR